MEIILETKNIFKSFGGIHALKNVDFALHEGEVLALLGANGAGKSTLIKILSGAQAPDSGNITILGEKRDFFASPREASICGISAVYQEFSLVNALSVAENIYMGSLLTTHRAVVDWRKIEEKASMLLSQMGTEISPKQLVKNLSVAEKQLVEIAKALSKESKVLIMDEPTSALSENDVQKLFSVIRGLQGRGISIIYVSHRLEELPQIADRVTVFRDGENVISLPIKNADKHTIIKHMVGEVDLGAEVPSKRMEENKNKVVLSLENLTATRKFYNISFDLHQGEIIGLAGLAGAGRTELARVLFGADPINSGKIIINGKSYHKIKSPIHAKKLGIGFVTENRKEEGLLLKDTIKNNILLTILKKVSSFFIVKEKIISNLSDKSVTNLGIKCSNSSQKVMNLSGGNQQKVVFAKWLATEPSILIIDEPTRGIDVGAKKQIYDILENLAKQGVAVLLISSEIPEILQISHRILVMSNGHITFNKINNQIDQNEILHHSTMTSV